MLNIVHVRGPPDITREKVLAVLSHTVPVDIQC